MCLILSLLPSFSVGLQKDFLFSFSRNNFLFLWKLQVVTCLPFWFEHGCMRNGFPNFEQGNWHTIRLNLAGHILLPWKKVWTAWTKVNALLWENIRFISWWLGNTHYHGTHKMPVVCQICSCLNHTVNATTHGNFGLCDDKIFIQFTRILQIYGLTKNMKVPTMLH